MTGVGSNPALATCETSQVLLAGVSGGFPGVLPFLNLNLNLNSLLVKRQIDNTSPGAVTGGN